MTTEPPAYGRARTVARLALLAGGLFVVGTNAFVIAGVLPSIAGDLGADQTAVASSITWYAAVVAVAEGLPHLGDGFGIELGERLFGLLLLVRRWCGRGRGLVV